MFGTSGGSSLFGARPGMSTGQSLFGNTATQPAASTSSGFSFFNTPASSAATGGLFNNPTATAPKPGGGLFSFNQPRSTAPGTGLFNFSQPSTAGAQPGLFAGTQTATGGYFANQQPQAQPPSNGQALGLTEKTVRLVQCVTSPVLFGDERDGVVTRLNQLQAAFGTGKGAISQGVPPIDITPDNPMSQFKAVCYNLIPKHQDSEGLVGLVVKQKAEDITEKAVAFSDTLHKILGSKPNIHVQIESVKPLPENKAEVILFLTETGATGMKRRIPATELAAYLMQPTFKQQMEANLTVSAIFAKAEADQKQLDEYKQTPPAGIHPLVWAQAHADNPEPTELIPWPVLGYDQLSSRQKAQLQEVDLQGEYSKELGSRIRELEDATGNLNVRLRQLRNQEQSLQQRLLKVVSWQYARQKQGFSLDAPEEQLWSRLEVLTARLNAPMQLKGRLSEILSAVRSQPELLAPKSNQFSRSLNNGADPNPQGIDPESAEEISSFLRNCQNALEKLVGTMESDKKDLEVVSTALQSRPNNQAGFAGNARNPLAHMNSPTSMLGSPRLLDRYL